MPRYELVLRVDAPGVDDFGGSLTGESARVRSRVYRDLGLKAHSNAWARINLSSAKGVEKVQRLHALREAGEARAGPGHIHEQLDESESATSDWFYLFTKPANDSFSLWNDYPSFKMSDIGADHAYSNTFVSADFVAACEQHGLRGISFLRCRQRGRKPGPAWFVALPAHSLDRGLDHVWFDRAQWLNYIGDDKVKRSSSPETGQHAFHQMFFRPDLVQGTAFMESLLRMFPMSRPNDSTLPGLNFVTVPRFWSRAFPETDFAYTLHGEDGFNREGKIMRDRKLMVSRHARNALIDAGLFTHRMFLAVRSVDTPEQGIEILDAHVHRRGNGSASRTREDHVRRELTVSGEQALRKMQKPACVRLWLSDCRRRTQILPPRERMKLKNNPR
jgi:hypothetical protein